MADKYLHMFPLKDKAERKLSSAYAAGYDYNSIIFVI